jgi:hypothetical protein
MGLKMQTGKKIGMAHALPNVCVSEMSAETEAMNKL